MAKTTTAACLLMEKRRRSAGLNRGERDLIAPMALATESAKCPDQAYWPEAFAGAWERSSGPAYPPLPGACGAGETLPGA